MVPNKDYYADKDGNLTDDPAKYAVQIAVAGVLLDDRIAKRYGIEDSLVSVDEPRAVRQVRLGGESEPAKETEPKKEPEPEPRAETSEAEAPEPKAKKGAKKNVKVR